MNVISYINGDQHVTDFPVGSARPLSLLVQSANDLLAGPDGYLSPENSVLALDLAWLTVGTADVPESVVHSWLAELLTDDDWGVLRFAKLTAHKAIRDIAALHRSAAAGEMPSVAQWDAAARAALAVASTLEGAGNRAVRAAFESTRFVDGELFTSLDRVIAHAENVHAMAAGRERRAGSITAFTGQAIRAWRRLAGARRDDTAGAPRRPAAIPAHA